MKRKYWWRLLLVVLLAVAAGVCFYVAPRLPVMTGYAAKNMCSCVFVGGRDPADVQATDLAFFPIGYTHSDVDFAGKRVTASVLGLASRTAIFREGLGCTLLVGVDAAGVVPSSFDPVPAQPLAAEELPWPAGDRFSDTVPPGVDRKVLDQAVAAAFDPEEGPAVKNTRAVVVVYRGQLVAEAYGPGFEQNMRLLGWSMTKSVVNALVGILVGEGKLALAEKAGIAAWEDDERREITFEHLLQMSSGLQWNEGYGDLSDVTRMLYLNPDMADYTFRRPLEFPPGSQWEYSSGTTNILSFRIRQILGDDQAYLTFARERLFNRIGMRSALIEPDASGTLVGSSYGWATARDWARFGLLFLNEGVWLGERILPEGWTEYASSEVPASEGEYGAHFWLNRGGKLPDVPRDMYACQGYQGQRIFILPNHDLVVVRLGLADANVFDFNAFLTGIVAAFPGAGNRR